MLFKASTLKGFSLRSLNGDIGKVEEFYFDDLHWAVRYLVAETGGWLTGKQVLISPYALISVNPETEDISVNLTQKQIEDSPPLESEMPVSKQYEEAFNVYYGWPAYWSGPLMWGTFPYVSRDSDKWKELTSFERTWDPNLRSTKDVSGHYIQATDGEIGHVDDFIIDDETWAIRYLVIDTKNWWPGKKVLISPNWIEKISWEESKVFVNLLRSTIEQSPEYDDLELLTREYESGLHRHYGRKEYWID